MVYHQHVFPFNLNIHLIIIESRKNFHFKRFDMLSLSICIHKYIYLVLNKFHKFNK